ncbi:hypothetical protein [Lentzea sp. E54]|uniref:hypothetical protein n=1 Tax=Lentzea xerophila TaxID=3435883 RepID=UPI003DA47727
MAGAVGIVFGLCVLSFTLGAALMYVLVRRREDAASGEPSPGDAPVERTWVEKPAAVEPAPDDYDTRPIHRNPVVGLPHLEPALAVFAEPVSEPVSAPVSSPVAKLVAEAGLPVKRDVDLGPVVPEPVDEGGPAPGVEAGPKVAEGGRAPVDEDGPMPVAEIRLEPVAEVGLERVADVGPEPVAAVGLERVAELGLAPVAEVEPAPLAEPETVGAVGYDQDGDLDPPMGELETPEPTVAADTDTSQLPPLASPQPVEHTTWVEREDFRQRYLRTFEEVRRKAGSN